MDNLDVKARLKKELMKLVEQQQNHPEQQGGKRSKKHKKTKKNKKGRKRRNKRGTKKKGLMHRLQKLFKL